MGFSLCKCAESTFFNVQKAEDSIYFIYFSLESNPLLLSFILLKQHSAALQLMRTCPSKNLAFVVLLKEKILLFLAYVTVGHKMRLIHLRTKGKHSSTLQSDHKTKDNGQLQRDEWAHRHRETTLVSAMSCNLTIVTIGITGRKTIGKRMEPREAFYLQRNSHLSTWWQSSQNKNRNCCNVGWDGVRSPRRGQSPGRLAQPSSRSKPGHARNHENTSVTNFPSHPSLKEAGGAAFVYD